MNQYIIYFLLIIITLVSRGVGYAEKNPPKSNHLVLSDCEIEVEVPQDFLVCPGEDFLLEGNISSSYDSFLWCENGEATNYDLQDMANITEETTFTLKAVYDSGDNLVINGDFESGDAGFDTDYVSVGPGSANCFGAGYLDCEGTYAVISDPSEGHTNFSPCISDNMMVVNGAASFQNIWCQFVCVSPNSSYEFSAEAASVNPDSPGLLQFSIDGDPLGGEVGLSSPCSWISFVETWESTGQTTVQICVTNQNTAAGGNDFALDNIAFYETCMDQESVTVFVSEIEIEIDDPADIDCNTSEVTIYTQIIANGISDIQWSTPDGNIIEDRLGTEITVDQPGLYLVTVTDDTGCTKEELTEVYPGTGLIELELSSDGIITCDNPDVEISIITSNQDLDYQWYDSDNSVIGDTESLIVNQGGLYTLIAESQISNCTITKEITIEADTIAPFFMISKSNDLDCFNDNATVAIDIQADSLTWQTPNNFTEDISSRSSFTTAVSGTYIAYLENGNGCSHSDTVNVLNISSVIPYSITADNLIDCNTPTSQIDIVLDTSFFDISWSNLTASYDDSLSFTIDQAGTYYVTFLDTLGCEENDSIVIMADFALPTLGNVDASEIDCNNNESTIIADNPSGHDITWTHPNGNSGNGDSFQINQTGYVSYTYSGDNGCSQTDSIEVIASAQLPIISINGDDLSCLVDESTLTINSNLPLVNYSWSGPSGALSNTESVTIDEGGTYNLEVLSDAGCRALASIEIAADTIAPTISLPTDATLDCDMTEYNGSAMIDGSYSQLVYTGSWYNENDNTLSVTEPDTYSIKIIGDNGCESESMMTIDIDTSSVLFSIQGDSLLNCNTNSVVAELQSADSYRSLSWESNNFSSDQESITIEDPGIYNLSVTGDNGCISLADHIVTEDISTPNFMAMASEIDCEFLFSTVIVDPLDDIVETNYYDETGALLGSGNSLTTDYTGVITIEVIGANGCENTDEIQAQVNMTSFSFNLLADSLTCNRPSVMIEFDYNLSYETATISDANNNLIGDITTPITQAGIYTVEVTLDNGCSSSSDIEIFSDNSSIEFIVLDAELDCNFTPLEIKFFTMEDYERAIVLDNDGNEIGDENTLISEIGTYTIVVTATNGCERSEDFVINEPSNPIEFIEYTTFISDCEETVLFYASDVTGGTPPYDYLIDGVSPPAATDNFITGVGIHNIYIVDAKGCSIDTSFTLEAVDPVIIEEQPEIEVTFGENQQLLLEINRDLSEIESISWTEEKDLSCYDCLDPIFSGTTNTAYLVTVTDINGCIDEVELRIKINRVIPYYVPNVIRISDGNDNSFTIFSVENEIEEIESLLIYDRWGNNMYNRENFAANDTSLGWNGLYNDVAVEQGVYVYYAILRLANGEVESVAGDLTVLR